MRPGGVPRTPEAAAFAMGRVARQGGPVLLRESAGDWSH